MHRRSLLIPVTLVAALAACGSGDDDDATRDTAPDSVLDPAPTSTAVIRTGDSEPTTVTTVPVLADPTDDKAPTVTTPPDAPNPSDEPLYEEGDIDRGLTPFIEVATIDLAERLGVDAAEITTHAAVLVVWPDSSLGCPDPEMVYTPVLNDGSAIELEHEGLYHRYHTGGDSGPFYCEPGGAASAPSVVDLFTVPDEDA